MKRYLTRCLLLTIVFLAVAFQPVTKPLRQSPRQSKPTSTIGYTLQHPLHSVHGLSNQVSSELMVTENGKRIQQVVVSVPVRSFDSGNRKRDRDMLKVTEAARYPEASFISSKIEEQNGALSVTGKLTFHGVTREINFTAQQQWQGDELTVDGDFVISLDSYNIKRPSIFTMKIKDNMEVRFHMVY